MLVKRRSAVYVTNEQQNSTVTAELSILDVYFAHERRAVCGIPRFRNCGASAV